jgi:hypothetical protein
MGFDYEDGASRWRQCWPLSAKAPYGLRLEMKCIACNVYEFQAELRPHHHNHRARVAGADHRGHQEDRISPDQAVLDEALGEGLAAV